MNIRVLRSGRFPLFVWACLSTTLLAYQSIQSLTGRPALARPSPPQFFSWMTRSDVMGFAPGKRFVITLERYYGESFPSGIDRDDVTCLYTPAFGAPVEWTVVEDPIVHASGPSRITLVLTAHDTTVAALEELSAPTSESPTQPPVPSKQAPAAVFNIGSITITIDPPQGDTISTPTPIYVSPIGDLNPCP